MKSIYPNNHKPIFILLSFMLLVGYFKFFYLLPLPGGFGGGTNQIIPMLLTNTFVIVSLYQIFTWKLNDFFFRFIFLFMVFIGLECVYTFVKYPGEPLINSIKYMTVYTNLFSYCIFYKVAKANLRKFLRVLVTMCSVIGVMFIIQAFIFNYTGIKILKVQGFSYGNTDNLMIRNGIRLIAADLVTFVGMLSIGLYYLAENTKVEKQRYLANIIITMLYCVFATQTRSTIMGMVTVFVLINLFSGEKHNKKRIFLVLFIIFGLAGSSVFIIRYFFKFYSQIVDKTDYSLYHRILCYSYFWECIIRNPIFGNGLLSDQPTVPAYFFVVHGPMANIPGMSCGYSDVGLIGTMGYLGITGGIFYLIPLLKCFQRYKACIKRHRKNTVDLAIVLIIAFSTINLSLFDAERIMILPIFMAVSEVLHQRENGVNVCMKL